MKVKPTENTIMLQGKATIELNRKQRWDAKESKIPGIIMVENKPVKISLFKDEFNVYFTEV